MESRVIVFWVALVLCCQVTVHGEEMQQRRSRPRRGVMHTRPTQYLFGMSGSFNSPGFPNNYPTNTEQTYILMMPTSSHKYSIYLTLERMQIEKEMHCNWDYLGWGPAADSITKKICGSVRRAYTMEHVQHKEVFKFYSDYMVVGGGFRANYIITKETDACDYVPCMNNGTCTLVGSGYSCTCQSGFTGTHCEQSTNPCDSSPCFNSAQCTNTFGSHYHCNCSVGFTGKHCETDMNECMWDPCKHSGTCINTHGSFYCYCQADYYGETCEFQINPCNSSTCDNNGVCYQDGSSAGFHCDCPVGYTGQYCESSIQHVDNSTSGFNPFLVYSKLALALNKTETAKSWMQSVWSRLNNLKNHN